MAIEKRKNEYGTYLYQEFIEGTQRANGKIVVYIHDQYDNPDVFNKFGEQLKFFDYYSVSLPGDDLFESEELHKNSFNYTCKYVRDLILSFNAKNITLIAHGTGAAIAIFLGNVLNKKIDKICFINPFTSKISVDTIRWISTLPRNVEDMKKVLDRMYYPDDKLIFNRGLDSASIILRMKNVAKNWVDISNFVENMVTIKILDELRIYEENIKCPIQMILGKDDKWITPQESLLAFNNCNHLSRLEMPNAMHYPLHDQEQATINSIMKFIIRGTDLYSDQKLPNKYVYKYLDDEWKQFYRSKFEDSLNARDMEEYEKKVKDYEKSQPTIKFKNEEYSDYIKEYANQQTQSLNMIYDQVSQQYNQTKQWEAEYKKQCNPTIQIDYNIPPNSITYNAQGYEVYHDGRGRGYYREPGGDWKKIKK